MNPPTAPSPKPALTSPVRPMVRMAPAFLSEVLPGACVIPAPSRSHRIHEGLRSARADSKGRVVFRSAPGHDPPWG
ncbi:hypothetical protein GCM10010385_01180 [Streptomyces geysiriensis]|nr:hypothetical protein GCM10010385_01180 [Streptomyces geysiriensis]